MGILKRDRETFDRYREFNVTIGKLSLLMALMILMMWVWIKRIGI